MLVCKVHPNKYEFRTDIETIPGDKSISHRAFMLGSLIENTVSFKGVLESEDCLNTLKIMRALGANIQKIQDEYVIKGVGLHGLTSPGSEFLDVGNSGTAIRLLSGLLAVQPFSSTLTGDASIVQRPMKRVVDPLSSIGAAISGVSLPGSSDIYPPLTVHATDDIHNSIDYSSSIASAQVKSAFLLAGLYTQDCLFEEPEASRDHTERLLSYFNADITQYGNKVRLKGQKPLINPNPDKSLRVPGDMSSSLFFIVLALLNKNAHLQLRYSNLAEHHVMPCVSTTKMMKIS